MFLIKEAIIYGIKQKIITEFIQQGLHKTYKKEIEEWFVYLDQQKFGRKLKIQMIEEVERYIKGRKTIDELMDEVFEKPDWEKLFIEDIPVNYVFKSALGYA